MKDSLQKAKSELIWALRHKTEGQPKAIISKLERIIANIESLQGKVSE